MTRERHAVLDLIHDQVPPTPEAFERLVDHRERRARAARMRAAVVGSAIALAIVVGAVATWSSRDVDADRGPQPAEELGGARLVARDGEYYYQRIVRYGESQIAGEDGDPPSASVSTTELWLGPDGSARVIQKPADEPVSGTIDERYGEGEVPDEWYVDLPDDADAVIDALIARSAPGGASPVAIATTSPGRSPEMTAVLRAMQDLLTFGSGIPTPSQQAALLRAAATIADVTTETGVVDPLGRPATKLSFLIHYDYRQGSTVEWYVEPSTQQLLAELWIDRASGRTTSAFLVEAAGIAPSIEEPPAPRALYVPEGADGPTFP